MGEVVTLNTLSNIPASLRHLADQIDSGEINAKHVIVAIQRASGRTDYVAAGDRLSGFHALGLLAAVQKQILDNSS